MLSFIEALEQKNSEGVRKAWKSDIHNHVGRGGSPEWLSQTLSTPIPAPPKKFESLEHMQEWFVENIKPLCKGKEGNILRWEACFAEAKNNNIKRLVPSFGIPDVELVGGMNHFIDILETFHETYCKDTLFEPELAYSSYSDVEYECGKMDEYLSYGYFKSIDLNSGENIKPYEYYVPLYRKAEEYGLVKKAHVGEFGTAEDIEKAVELLGLDEIHHGIAAATSESTMRLLADRNIQLNICPSSNVMLGVVESYEKHPIQTLVRHGVPVTINTDDLLIFQQSIDKEYINLWKSGTLTASELDQIRIRGLGKRGVQ